MPPPFPEFQQLCILVAGDLMLDRYLWGRADRISPEAPVPVVLVQEEEARPGGAANVALNLHALGVAVKLGGVIGQDAAGGELLALMESAGFGTGQVLALSDRPTTLKTRVLAQGQQMLRYDREENSPLPSEAEGRFLALLLDALPGCHALIFQDYDKGALTPWLIRELTRAACEQGIPVMVDPKFRNFWSYAQCSLFKPNLKELAGGLGRSLGRQDRAAIAAGVAELRARMPHAHTLVTLSEEGMLLFGPGMESGLHLPAHRRRIADVSGAGDTVIAVAGAARAAGYTWAEAARLANLAGGLVCELPGVVPVDPARLAAEWKNPAG